MSKTTKESSVVGNIKGFQAPLGAKAKKKNNPSKPYGEDEMFENIVVSSELKDNLSERIEKRGNEWIVIDPRTGVQVDRASSRDEAREKQKQHGITVERDPSKKKTKDSNSEPVKHRKPKDSKKVEGLKSFFRKMLEESSMLSFLYQENNTNDNSIWENFTSRLPREAVIQDVGLNEVLREIAETEARVLAKSVFEIKKVLESSGLFMVERHGADQDPETGDVRMPFSVTLKGTNESVGGNSSLLFGIKLESGRPTILFPEESRNALNNLLTRESKLLRAELLHLQETVLDKYNDVVEVSSKRNTYLGEMRKRLKEVIDGMNLVEVSVVRSLVREKLKGVK